MISFKVVTVGSYCVNCVVVSDGEGCIVVDPGQEADRISGLLTELRLKPLAIVLTHGHFDHIGGLPGLFASYPGLPVYAHPSDWPMFGHPLNQMPPDYPSVPRPDDLWDVRKITDDLPGFGIRVLETPGHTPGSVCLNIGDHLISGDTLFAGSCGRTDFPGGSMASMRKSLESLAQLPPKTLVIPGHGPSTTIGNEVANNPFMV